MDGPSTVAQRQAGVARRTDGVGRVRLGRMGPVAMAEVIIGLQLVGAAWNLPLDALGRSFWMLASVGIVAAGIACEAGGPAARAMGALIIGAIGIAIGAALGVAPLAVSGPALGAALGIAALAAGLLAFAAGTARLYRTTRGWWRLSAIVVPVVLVQFAILPIAGAVVGIQQPRTGASFEPPPGSREVTLRTVDGVDLIGWYRASENGAAVILLPGSGGNRADTLSHAAVLARHGYGTLALDARGQGRSGGRANAWGWTGPVDVAAALDFLEARADVDPSRIAAVGLSMGAEQAISAAAVDERLRAVVAEGASARAFVDLAYVPMDPSGVVERVVAWETFALADLLTSASQPGPLRDAITQLGSRKLLLIVGDARDERLAAPGFEQAGGSSVDRWDLPDVPHIQALAEHPTEWERRVIGFLDRELQP